MADVSIYIAAISAAAGVAGAAVSPVALAFRDSRQSKRDRQERQAAATRQACVDLLRAAGDLRTQVANTRSYHGTDIGARLENVRRLAADTELHAANAAMLVPTDTADLADQLAIAAGKLADWTVQNTSVQLGSLPVDPDFSDLNASLKKFREQAVSDVQS